MLLLKVGWSVLFSGARLVWVLPVEEVLLGTVYVIFKYSSIDLGVSTSFCSACFLPVTSGKEAAAIHVY